MAELAEDFLKYIFSYVLDNCEEDMAFFNRWFDDAAISTLEGIVKSSFERLTYTEAVDLLKASTEDFEYPVEWGLDLQSEHETVPDGEEDRPAGHRHRLPQRNKGLLYALER